MKQGQALAAIRTELGEKVAEVAWQTDLSAARRHLAGYGDSFLRVFNRNYREAVATLKGVLKGKAPRELNERLKLLDAVISAQATSRSLDGDGSLSQVGRDAFGTEWNGSQSDWGNLAEILAWDDECRTARLSHGHRGVLMGLDQPELCRDSLNALSARLRPSFDRLKALLEPFS